MITAGPIGIPLAQNVVSAPATAHSAKVVANMGTLFRIAKSVASTRTGVTQDITQSSVPVKVPLSTTGPPSFLCNFQRPQPNQHRLQLPLHRSRRHTTKQPGRYHLHRQAQIGITLQLCDPTLLMQPTSTPRPEQLQSISDGSRRKNNRSSARKLPTTLVV